ncbi:hypothetical protein [Microbacterium algeriense]|uniref:hypothetical protein n=1 Tax=Microbacterium algeriense TaxID=2615184 RepID=UPI0029AF2408|nr:hypothetical protein [Microbacterium algeriense]MDX2401480.1 hypothetical protein [Microbacterium algeriense]
MTDTAADATDSDDAASVELVSGAETTVISIPSLEALNEAYAGILRDPVGSGLAKTDAEASVLGNVRAAFVSQKQLPIPSKTSAARGAYVALMAAAQHLQGYQFWSPGDLRPDDALRLPAAIDANGLLNPMRLFEDDMNLGLYPISSAAHELRGKVSDEALNTALKHHALVLVSIEEPVDWDTWMATFAR